MSTALPNLQIIPNIITAGCNEELVLFSKWSRIQCNQWRVKPEHTNIASCVQDSEDLNTEQEDDEFS